VGVALDVLLQEEWAHIRRRLKRLSLEKISSDFDAGLFNLFRLPVVQKIVKQMKTETNRAGLEECRSRGSCCKVRTVRLRAGVCLGGTARAFSLPRFGS